MRYNYNKSKPKRINPDLCLALDRLALFEIERVGYKINKSDVHRKLANKINKLIERKNQYTLIDWYK
jgi:hypothetical protein